MNDHRLENLLRTRPFVPHDEALAFRIVAAARAVPRVRRQTFLDLLGALFVDLSLPRPAYVLSVLLLFGVFAGALPGGGRSASGVSADDLGAFVEMFSVDESLESEEDFL